MLGAKVIARNIGTNIAAEAISEADGYFRFPLLKVGTYNVSVTAAGFKEATRQGIQLSVGQKLRPEFNLEIGAITEVVEVKGDAPTAIADTAGSVIGAVLSTAEVENLPIVSRNIYNYFLLSPGVQGLSSATFGTTSFTFGGSEKTAWNTDGLDNTQRGNSRQIRMVISTPEAVEETQVLANGYSAEFGRASGGQVNVILKSGTNAFHGSAMYLYRATDMQARPSLAAINPPNRSWHDDAFTLGGPILKDRLFFFTQFEDNPYTLPAPITITSANAAALQLPSSQTGFSPFYEIYHTYTGKVNYKLNDSNSGYLRYSRFTNSQPYNTSGLTVPSAGTNFHDLMNAGGAQLATVLSPTLLNELRGGVIRREQHRAPSPSCNASSALIAISGVATIGCDPVSVSSSVEQSAQLVDNVTWTHGRSTWKAGVDYQNTHFDVLQSKNRQFTFGGLAAANGRAAVSPLNQYLDVEQGLTDPATGKPYTYTQLSYDGGVSTLSTSFNFVNFFLQDEFRITPRFTINVGVRYELMLMPGLDPNAPYPLSRKVNNDAKDVAPRFSFNWSPFKDGKTVVRGAYGIYYDVPNLALIYNAALVNGDKFLSYSIAGTDPNAPAFPNVPAVSASNYIVPPSINVFASGFRNAYQEQVNFQIQREVVAGWIATAGYNWAALRHGLYSVNVNVGAPASYLADGRPVFGTVRPNPQFNQINVLESGGNTNYNALFLNLQKRLSKGLVLNLSYTYSHTLGDTLGEGAAVEDPTNARRDYGNLDNDLRHYFVGQAIYEFHPAQQSLRWARDIQLSTMMFFNSGYPINVVSGIDLNHDGILNDRPVFVGRNNLYGPPLRQIDARLQKAFAVREGIRLIGLIEAENLLNSTNANCSTSTGCSGAVVNTAGAADFGRITSARTARNVQFGAKLTF